RRDDRRLGSVDGRAEEVCAVLCERRTAGPPRRPGVCPAPRRGRQWRDPLLYGPPRHATARRRGSGPRARREWRSLRVRDRQGSEYVALSADLAAPAPRAGGGDPAGLALPAAALRSGEQRE